MPRNRSEKPIDLSKLPPGWRVHRWPSGRVQLTNECSSLATQSAWMVSDEMIANAWDKWSAMSGMPKSDYFLLQNAKFRINELEAQLKFIQERNKSLQWASETQRLGRRIRTRDFNPYEQSFE